MIEFHCINFGEEMRRITGSERSYWKDLCEEKWGDDIPDIFAELFECREWLHRRLAEHDCPLKDIEFICFVMGRMQVGHESPWEIAVKALDIYLCGGKQAFFHLNFNSGIWDLK